MSAVNGLSWLGNRTFLRVIVLLLSAVLAFVALIFPTPMRPSASPLTVGAVASQDIQAPRVLTYTSDILSVQARQDAENRILPVYLPADPSIARQQIEKLRISLNYITSVREDTYATPEQKLADLAALENVTLSQGVTEQILSFSDQRWDSVQLETLSVLEQVMRNSIRESQLNEAKRNVPTLVSFALPQDQASLVAELVSQFVIPNSLQSDEQTALRKQEARDNVEPAQRTFAAGETIVQRGQVITPLILEALQVYDLIQPQDNSNEIIAAAVLVALTALFASLYFFRRKQSPGYIPRNLASLSATFLMFLYTARLIVPNHTVIPYLFPIPAFGLTIASLFSLELGMVFSLILSILAAFGLPNSFDLTLFYILSSLCGILVLGRGRRVASFFWAGLAVGVAGSSVVLSYRLFDSVTDPFGIATLIGAAVFNGIASASLALILQFLLSQILGMTTALQLLEISRPDHPLLQYVMRNAPGTYQHSLQVANLAEQAAESIGADALLVRVGAIYHDVGKSSNPLFFIENQIPGVGNPHNDLDPISSATIILNHVSDGVKLARKHHLPPRIQDFIREHHGTAITRYQYAKALEAVDGDTGKVNLDQFRYPGPRPRSRETALLMLADGCEARARAELPKTEEELREIVKKTIDFTTQEGQLDDTSLTLRDLSVILDSFVNTLRNTHHPRLRYPEIKKAPVESQDAAAQTPAPEVGSANPAAPASSET